MAKALIICVAGMSSSLMAQKTTDYFKTQGKDITVEAISSNEGERVITGATYDCTLLVHKLQCITTNLRQRVKNQGDLLSKFHHKLTFQSQWVLRKWLI